MYREYKNSRMPAYKLTYFNGKGRAELARLLFAKAGVAYEDIRLERDQWPPLKDSMPFGSLPVLEVDGVKIGQSFAIASYLAKKFGLYGKTDIEEALVNGVCFAIEDLLNLFVSCMFTKDEAKKAELKKSLEEEKLPAFLKYLERIAEKNGSGFLVGSDMTLADIHFANSMNAPKMMSLSLDMAEYPKLQDIVQKVETDANIADWIKNRPVTAM